MCPAHSINLLFYFVLCSPGSLSSVLASHSYFLLLCAAHPLLYLTESQANALKSLPVSLKLLVFLRSDVLPFPVIQPCVSVCLGTAFDLTWFFPHVFELVCVLYCNPSELTNKGMGNVK